MDSQNVQRVFDLIRAVELLASQDGCQPAIVTNAEETYNSVRTIATMAIIRGDLTAEVVRDLEDAARSFADELVTSAA